MKLKEKQDRREFFRTCARYTALAVLGATGGELLTRKVRDRQSHECMNQGLCDGCREFSACGLPQALSAKQEMAGNQPENYRLKVKE